jgi:thiamine biosynthesis lipoprotein
MGTLCEAALPGAEDPAPLFAEAERIEAMLSTWRPESELSRLNRGDDAAPSAELVDLLARVERWRLTTGGAFDHRIRPLIDTWKTRAEGELPSPAALEAALQQVRSGRAAIEEGGFGKGYALDRMLERTEAPRAVINFGGQIAVRGPARATIADPRRRDVPVLALTFENASLSTSSGSEKTFTAGGRRFSHIFDPRTGEALPPRGSVSVVASSALDADILSTALYVMGEAEGLRWADSRGVAALFINESNEIRLSAAMRDRVRDLELLDRKFNLKD